MDNLSFNLSPISEDRVCIEITISGVSLGLVYYERAKRGYNKKPISMNRWVCVDAKVEDVYVYGSMEIEHLTPKDILDKCQKIISGL